MRTASASSFRRAASVSTRALYFSALEGDDASFVEPDAAAAGVVDAEGAEGGFFEAISAGAEACSGLAARELVREFARELARLRLRRREDPLGGGFPPPPRSVTVLASLTQTLTLTLTLSLTRTRTRT